MILETKNYNGKQDTGALVDKPDVVHIHSSFGPSFYRKMPFIYMANWAKKPITNHIHGAYFDEFYVNASDKKRRQIKGNTAKSVGKRLTSESKAGKLIFSLGKSLVA